MTLPLQVVHEDNVTIIYCPERVIAEETEELRTAAVKAIEQTGRVIFQLASVQKLDSTGLGLLASLCMSARKRSGDVKLVAPSPQIKELLHITLLGRVFDVHPTVEAALAAFQKVARAAH
jgi:anti-sigma B factor antagonist